MSAVFAEIRNFRRQDTSPIDVDTIYFGGGTPSLLSTMQIARILEAVYERFRVTDGAELTMEIDPGTVETEGLRELRYLGINRASFGAQTFDDSELKRLGRSHTAEDTIKTIRYLRESGFDNTSFDLIAGLPAQTLETWSSNLDKALELRPEHLSFYLLEVHEGTPLAAQIKRGQQPPPDDDVAAQMYQLMLERACAAGYEHYEISNLCLAGYESLHNTKYWTGAPVYGFGCSAHSYDGLRTRTSNERDAKRYIELIESRGNATVETIELSEHERRAEAIFLGLRLMRGLDLREFEARFGKDIRQEYADDLSRLRDARLIQVGDQFMKLTHRGALLSNEVFVAFV